MGVFAADEKYFADMIGEGGRTESVGDVAHIDGLDASVGRQHRFEENQIEKLLLEEQHGSAAIWRSGFSAYLQST